MKMKEMFREIDLQASLPSSTRKRGKIINASEDLDHKTYF